MKLTKLSILTAAAFLGLATTNLSFAAGGLDALQAKVNAEAQKAGIKAPDVKKELAGKASAEEADEDNEKRPTDIAKYARVEKMISMNVNNVRAIQYADGRIAYILDDGRFALTGTLIDVWNRRKIETLSELADAVSHIDLQRIGFELEKTNHITVGTGGERVKVFVDPRCGYCHQVLKEINENPDLLKQYTFDIVIVKILGEGSGVLAEKLACAKTTNQMEKFKALVSGKTAINELEQVEKCNRTVLNDTELQRNALNIQGVPFIVSSDKRFVRGKPQSLRAFLDVNEAKLEREREENAQKAALKKAADEMASDDPSKGGAKRLKDDRKRIPLRDQKPAN